MQAQELKASILISVIQVTAVLLSRTDGEEILIANRDLVAMALGVGLAASCCSGKSVENASRAFPHRHDPQKLGSGIMI